MQLRVNWVDNLKTMGILAVVMGHMNSPYGRFIFSWHMPLFFIVGGFFLKKKVNLKEWIKTELPRFLILYISFNFLGLLAEILKRMLLERPSLEIKNELVGLFWKMDYAGLSHHYGFILWFLVALFWGRLFIVLLRQFSFLVIPLFLLSFQLDLPLGLDDGMNASLWIWLGQSSYRFLGLPLRKLWPWIVASVVILFTLNLPLLDLATKFYENIPVNVLWASCLCFLLCVLARFVGEKFGTLGRCSLLLFLLHPYTNNLAYLIFDKNWWPQLLTSLGLLTVPLVLKLKYDQRGPFRYV